MQFERNAGDAVEDRSVQWSGLHATAKISPAASSRRAFLRRLVLLGASLPVVAACGANSSQAPNTSADASPGARAAAATTTGADCPEDARLSVSALATRTALGYVDVTAIPDQRCDNCRYFRTENSADACGTCEIVSGPIAAGGHCRAWAET